MTDRSPRWTSGIRVRVTLAAATMTLLGSLLGAVLFVVGLHENLEQSLVTSAHQQAESVVAQLAAGRSVEQATVSGKDDMFIQVVTPSGRSVASDHPRLTTPVRTTAGVTEGLAVAGLDDSYVVVATPARNGDLVVVGLAEEQVRAATRTSILLLALAVPIGVAAVSAVVWLSIGRALRPVEVMRSQAAAITSSRRHERLVVPPGDDEIPRLASTLNQMLDRIDASQQVHRQFVQDASHELRSPLATLRQIAEVAGRAPEATSVSTLAADVLAEEHRMEELVAALLVLARLDDAPTLPAARSVDLDDLVLGEVDRLRRAHPQLRFDQRRVGAGQVDGDPVLLRQLVDNLLHNAARHATSVVRIGLREQQGRTRLSVEDDGTGVPAVDRERIFERFARLDEARAREAGGAGLGLAIVQQVAATVGGSVWVEDSALGGARFVVDLPASE